MRSAKSVSLVLFAWILVVALVSGCAAPAAPAATQAPAPQPTAVSPTAVPPTAVPPTAAPPTAVPPTAVPPTAVPPTAVPAAKLKVAMLFSGSINDGAWNSVGYQSLVNAEKELGIEIAYVESLSVADSEAAMRDFCDKGFDLIMAHGNTYIDAALKVGADLPNCHLAVSQGTKFTANVVSYNTAQAEGNYLAGVLAAYMSKTGKIGFTAGMKVPSMLAAYNAWADGAKSVKADVEVLSFYPGVWADNEKSRQGCLGMVDAGADILIAKGDLGHILACKERDALCIGNVADQWELAPGKVLVSLVQDFTPYIKLMLDDVKAGKFGNMTYSLSLKDGVMKFSDYHGMVPDDVAKKIDETIAKMRSGELVVVDDPSDRGK